MAAEAPPETDGERARVAAAGHGILLERASLALGLRQIAQPYAQQPNQIAPDVPVQSVVDGPHGEGGRRHDGVPATQRVAHRLELDARREQERLTQVQRAVLERDGPRDSGGLSRRAVELRARGPPPPARERQVRQLQPPHDLELGCALGRQQHARDPFGRVEIAGEQRHAHGRHAHRLVGHLTQRTDRLVPCRRVAHRERAQRRQLGAEWWRAECPGPAHQRIGLRVAPLGERDPRQVQQRAEMVRLHREHARERVARLGERAAARRVAVVEHVAELVPRLHLVGVHGDERSIEPLCAVEVPRAEGGVRFHEQPRPRREARGVAHGAEPRAGHRVPPAARHPQQGVAELVVRQREGGVQPHGLLKGRLRRVEVARPVFGGAAQVCLQRRQRRGRERRQPGEVVRRLIGVAGEQLAGELVDEGEQLGGRAVHYAARRLLPPTAGIVQRGADAHAVADAHHVAEHEQPGAKAAGDVARLLGRECAAGECGLTAARQRHAPEQRAGIHGAQRPGPVEVGTQEVDHPLLQVAELLTTPHGEREYRDHGVRGRHGGRPAERHDRRGGEGGDDGNGGRRESAAPAHRPPTQ